VLEGRVCIPSPQDSKKGHQVIKQSPHPVAERHGGVSIQLPGNKDMERGGPQTAKPELHNEKFGTDLETEAKQKGRQTEKVDRSNVVENRGRRQHPKGGVQQV